MLAIKYDFYVEKGATFSLPLRIGTSTTPFDLSNYGVRIRASEYYGGPEIGEFCLNSVTDTTNIVTGGVLGTVDILVSAVTTASILFKGIGVYDLEVYHLTNPVEVYRILQGKLVLSERA